MSANLQAALAELTGKRDALNGVIATLQDSSGATVYGVAAPAVQAGGTTVVYSFTPDVTAGGSTALGFQQAPFASGRLPRNITFTVQVVGAGGGDVLADVRLIAVQTPVAQDD